VTGLEKHLEMRKNGQAREWLSEIAHVEPSSPMSARHRRKNCIIWMTETLPQIAMCFGAEKAIPRTILEFDVDMNQRHDYDAFFLRIMIIF
jgi:hypothetical protein